MSKSKYYKTNPNFKIQNKHLDLGFCLPAGKAGLSADRQGFILDLVVLGFWI